MHLDLKTRIVPSYFSDLHQCIILPLTLSDIDYALCSIKGEELYSLRCAYSGGNRCSTDPISSEIVNNCGVRCDSSERLMGFVKVESHYLTKYTKHHGLL